MSPLDLVRAKDGSMSLTKLAAATFHIALAWTVIWITWRIGTFVTEMWWTYSAMAVGHAVVDKTGAQIADYKTKKLNHDSPVATTTSTTTTVTSPISKET